MSKNGRLTAKEASDALNRALASSCELYGKSVNLIAHNKHCIQIKKGDGKRDNRSSN